MRTLRALCIGTILLGSGIGCRHACSTCGEGGVATGMNGLQAPVDMAVVHTWKPAYYTPPRPEANSPTRVEDGGTEMLNRPRPLPAGPPGL